MPTVTFDMTDAAVFHAGTKVGSGNVLEDLSDSTYFQLDGMANADSDVTSAGWILKDVSIPDFYSLNSITLTVRAEFYALTGAPTNANMIIAFTGYDGSGVGSGDLFPFEFSQFYAYALPGSNFPVAGTLPTGIQTYTYSLSDWSPFHSGTMSDEMQAAFQEGGVHFIYSPRWHFSDGFTTRVQAKVYEITLTVDYDVYVPPVFDDPPELPDGYSAWQELDLGDAVFLTNSFGTPYGRYDAIFDRILTNIGWPDFYFPGFELDPANDYYFQVVFDTTDPRHTLGWEDVYLAMLQPGDPQASYLGDGYIPVYQDDNWAFGDGYHLFHIDSGSINWDYLSTGFTLPYFDTGRYAVVAKIRWAVSEGVVTPPVFVDQRQRAIGRFWGQ